MYFSILKLVDRARCSFEIPDFESAQAERKWSSSLTRAQGFELMQLMNLARWGDEAMSRPMDKTAIQTLTMEQFRAIKDAEYLEDQAWLAAAERDFLARQESK